MNERDRISAQFLLSGNCGLLLLRLMAATMSLVAAINVVRSLLWPPPGSSGLTEAQLPALLLLVGLWFSGRGIMLRMGYYAVAASLLAVVFYFEYAAKNDWLFKHSSGPAQLLIASGLASTTGVLAGLLWFLSKQVPTSRINHVRVVTQSPFLRGVCCLSDAAVLVSTTLSATLAALTVPGLITDPLIMRKIDEGVSRNLRSGRYSVRELAEQVSNTSGPRRSELAEVMASSRVQPGDDRVIAVLQELTSDNDPAVRGAAVNTIRRLMEYVQNSGQQVSADMAARIASERGLSDADAKVQWQAALTVLQQGAGQCPLSSQLSAIVVLGSARDRESVDQALPALLKVIEGSFDRNCRREAFRALGRIGPAIGRGWSNAGPQAIFRLALELEAVGVSERKLAAESLAAMGDAAKASVPSFARAWEQKLLTIEEAQLLYRIDPAAAAKLKIPQPQSNP